MANNILKDRFDEIERLAKAAGLDPYDVHFFEVPVSTIYEVASYGLPTRYSHWTFGRVYEYQKTYGEMGFSKIYELILNNNPSYAFLDRSNPDTINLMICAHCYLEGTYVQTTNGLKPIEEIKTDDIILNLDGQQRVEYPTCSEFNGEIVTIQAGSCKFSQTDDHKLYAVKTDPNDRRKWRSWKKAFEQIDYKPEWIDASLLKPGDFLVVPKYPYVGSGNKKSIKIEIMKRLHNQNVSHVLEIPLSEDFGELVGLYLSEGYARAKGQMGLCFNSNEKHLHERSSYLIKSIFGLDSYTHTKEEQNSTQICFNEICVAKFFRENFGHSCYSKRLGIRWIEDSPIEFLKGVLIGFLNGDGTKSSKRSVGFTTTSPYLAMEIQWIAMRLGIYFGISHRDQSTEDQNRSISFIGLSSGLNDQKIRSLLGMSEREVDRSWSGVIERDKYFLVKINEITLEDYKGLVYCMKTSKGDSFTLENGILTHNCLAHSDFFKNNVMFHECCEQNMIDVAKKHAEMIDKFRRDYGDDEVDEWLDVALAFERHIDIHRGLYRKPYDKRKVEYEDRVVKPWEDLCGDKQPLLKKVIKNVYLPPYPEKDLLWFLTNYAPLEPWQETIFEIVRRESYYFYPQYRTKIMNEGWASYWHAELMRQYTFGNDNEYGIKDIKYPLRDEEHLDFLSSHEKVVQPGIKIHLKVEVDEIDPFGRPTGKKEKKWNPDLTRNPHLFSYATRLNPYYMGFRIFRDIKKRWDKYFADGYMKNEWGEKIPVTINGDQKIRQVMQDEDDVSFLRNYLTEELMDDLHLFSYGNNDKYKDDYVTQDQIRKKLETIDDLSDLDTDDEVDAQIIENKTVIARSKELKTILTDFATAHNNYGVPCIVVRRIDENGLARLEHIQDISSNIDIEYAKHVLVYFHKAWGRPVELIRKCPDKTYVLSYDGHEMEIDYASADYPESIEKNAAPSAW